MPYSEMPGWLRLLAYLNPVSYAIDSIRELLIGGGACGEEGGTGCGCWGHGVCVNYAVSEDWDLKEA